MAILKWVQGTDVDWHYIAPGKPQQNDFIGSFDGKLRPSRQIALQSPAGQWMNASMKRSSARWPTPAIRWKNGRRTTAGADHTQHWAT
jgi:hypothetical protein